MKMPEGWKRLESCARYEEERGDTISENKIIADLMKEMAEALEDLLRNPDQTKIPWVKYNRLLDDFKEWK